MAKPTESDFVHAHLIAHRIFLRRMFETLRTRPGSKYFKNIVIQDVAWGDGTTFKGNIPLNFPPDFFNKYPYDFSVSFTTLGCNTLKCYRHKKRCTRPVLINDQVLACGEACRAIYREFNDYLKERFALADVKEYGDRTNRTQEQEEKEKEKEEEQEQEQEEEEEEEEEATLPFETFSIYDSVRDRDYCGVQLTPLKTFAILPSARWSHPGQISAREYVRRYQAGKTVNSEYLAVPLQLGELAGLVDAPPLTWDNGRQAVRFNPSYCRRFNKYYDVDRDNCYHQWMRKGVNYLLGENFVNNAFPTLENIMVDGTLPFEYLNKNGGPPIDPGYWETPLTQRAFEQRAHVAQPDLITRSSRVIDTNLVLGGGGGGGGGGENEAIAEAARNAFAEIIGQVAGDITLEMSLTTLPNLSARLLQHYSAQFLTQALVLQHASGLPVSVRLFSLTTRLVLNELTVKFAVRILTSFSSAANVVFAVTLLTLLPDLILGYYNVGGFHNEITRQDLNRRRKLHLDHSLRLHVAQFGHRWQYVVVDYNNDEEPNNNNNNKDYVSPLVTPEFIYHLCLLNFLKYNSDQRIKIGHNAVATDEELEDVALEYLQCLKVNALGQRIEYLNPDKKEEKTIHEAEGDDNDNDVNDNDERVFIKGILAGRDKKKKRGYHYDHDLLMDMVLNYQCDLYILIMATLLLMISLILFLISSNLLVACIFLYASLFWYTIWFGIFLQVFITQ